MVLSGKNFLESEYHTKLFKDRFGQKCATFLLPPITKTNDTDDDRYYPQPRRLQLKQSTEQGGSRITRTCKETEGKIREITVQEALTMRSERALGPTPSGNFVCSKPGCGKTFSVKSNLKRHMITHTGIKPFKCNLCTRAFTRKADMLIHQRRIHEANHDDKRTDRLSGYTRVHVSLAAVDSHRTTSTIDRNSSNHPEKKNELIFVTNKSLQQLSSGEPIDSTRTSIATTSPPASPSHACPSPTHSLSPGRSPSTRSSRHSPTTPSPSVSPQRNSSTTRGEGGNMSPWSFSHSATGWRGDSLGGEYSGASSASRLDSLLASLSSSASNLAAVVPPSTGGGDLLAQYQSIICGIFGGGSSFNSGSGAVPSSSSSPSSQASFFPVPPPPPLPEFYAAVCRDSDPAPSRPAPCAVPTSSIPRFPLPPLLAQKWP